MGTSITYEDATMEKVCQRIKFENNIPKLCVAPLVVFTVFE